LRYGIAAVSDEPNWLAWATSVLSITAAVAAAGHAVVYKRDPRSATLWALLIVLLPLGGALFYVLFGINRYQRRARRLYPGACQLPRHSDSPAVLQGLLIQSDADSRTFACCAFAQSP